MQGWVELDVHSSCWYGEQATVLDSLKSAQEKNSDVDGLRQTKFLIDRLYREHDELDADNVGDLSDENDDNHDDSDDADENINLDDISDDSGLAIFVVYNSNILTDAYTHTTVLFYGCTDFTTQVSRYQKKHSPTHTYHGHQSPVICFSHPIRFMVSSLFNPRAWQSFWPIHINDYCYAMHSHSGAAVYAWQSNG